MLVVLDQVSKYFLTTITNTGAAFGILKGYNILLLIINLIALIICIFFYIKDKKLKLPLTFLIAGILGNLIDRIFFGYVRDFINLKFWPVFNLADSYNVIGVIILIVIIWKE
ncbi:signal peptidase II [Candidatus Woesearchaeota archaeon]|nr:signal peptidase II [Candidatus Woesearchaeota archaeon]